MTSLTIQATRRQGQALASPPTAVFGPAGGSIGRSEGSTLVLDDPDRTVSRLHAQVSWRDGIWMITDRGSNPLHLNGQALGAGREAPLHEGDALTIGSFELRVGIAGNHQGAVDPIANVPSPPVDDGDPFAHLLDGLVEPAAASPAKAASTPEPDPTAGLFPDPLSVGPSSPAAADPFADLLGSPSPAPVLQSPPGASQRPDDFSDLVTPSSAGSESIDALFGLGAPLANDPLAMTPLADPLMQPNTASAQDPLAALTRNTPTSEAARGDHLPVDAFAFAPPMARMMAPTGDPFQDAPITHRGDLIAKGPVSSSPLDLPIHAPAEVAPMSPPAPAERAAQAGPSVDSSAGAPPASQSVALDQIPSTSAQVVAAVASPSMARSPTPAPAPTPASAPAPAPAPAPSGTRVAEDELLAAFLRGLGPLQQAPALLTPGLMERVGDLLRSATEGTLQLLHTRQEFKHQVRAQVTVIAAQANNPLKFSPTVEVALAHLLGPGVRGFMPAEAAMRDAWQDLRAHEFGVMVGMRAALEHVIQQFSPEALEQNIAAKSRLDAIFSANRKAKLWDQFVKLYADIAREAEDDFHTLFGKAFLKAYEEQLDRLKVDGRK